MSKRCTYIMKPSSTAFVLSLELCLSLVSAGLRTPFERIPSGEWTQFDSWARSSPDVKQKYAVATTVVEQGINNSPRELMIMYGGAGYQKQDAATWIYDPEVNIWQSFLLSSHPPVNAFHSMVSLCGRRVVLFGGADTGSGDISSGNSSVSKGCRNETWIFDVNGKEWRFLAVRSRDNLLIGPRCKHAATALYQPRSACSCKESMFVYGGKSVTLKGAKEQRENLFDMWELRCVEDGDDTALPVFEWLLVHFHSNDSVNVTFPKAFSVFNKSELFLSGWTKKGWHLWSLNTTERKWTARGYRNDVLKSDRMFYLTGRKTNSESNFHILVYCCTEPVWTLDLESSDWYKADPIQGASIPEVRLGTAASAKVGGGALVFGGELRLRRPEETLWRLSALKPDLFLWAVVEADGPKLLYKGVMAGGIVSGNKVVLFGGCVNEPRINVRASDETWSLDLTTLAWSKRSVTGKPPGLAALAGVVLRQSYLVISGGVQLDESKGTLAIATFNRDTFVYDSIAIKWSKVTVKTSPPKRVLHTALAVNSSTMMVFGGVSISFSQTNGIQLFPYQDMWKFELGNMSHLTPGQWSRLQDIRLCTYMGHAAYIWKRMLVVYGGTYSAFAITPDDLAKITQKEIFLSGEIQISANCEDKMWEYNIDLEIWQQMNYSLNHGPGARCFPAFGRVGNNMIIHGGCSLGFELRLQLNTNIYEYKCSVETSKSGVWSYNVKTRMWTQLTATNPISAPRFWSLLLEWNGMILMFGGLSPQLPSSLKTEGWTGFSVFKPECPAGTYTFDFSSTGCHPCPVGLYSSSSGPNCTLCPDNLSTPHFGSTSIDNCTLCSSTVCDHGHCRVTVPGPEMYCECDFGYTKNDDGHCSVATYFLAGSGFLAGLILLLLVAAVLVRLRRARNGHRVAMSNKDRELVDLTNGWIVDCRELNLRRRIDIRSPGGFGDVYEAEYRDITVAVKKLKEEMLDMERTEMEFEREIQVMRAIRHPNIVLFLGVGRFHNDGCPFIVMEYMSRGSLGSILKNTTISLTNSQRIRFALDAAKGMRFLHGLRPPRIHRDLKSGNLLVSKRWVVKVADFGSARLVKDEAVDQEAVRGTGPLSLTAPLLQPQYELSTCVGTAFWTAPELLRGLSYGTAVDVYSFGVVLWEIWSRQLPFDDYRFPTVLDLKQAVIEGTRPTIPNNWPCDCVALIRECWSGAAVHRSTFRQIVEQLEKYNENHLLQDQAC